MRTILQIQIAVTEADPNISDEELRLCVQSLSDIQYFYYQSLTDLIKAIREGKPKTLLRLKAEFAWDMIERMFAAAKMRTPQEWLGPGNIPGTPEHKARLALGKRIYKQATGEEL